MKEKVKTEEGEKVYAKYHFRFATQGQNKGQETHKESVLRGGSVSRCSTMANGFRVVKLFGRVTRVSLSVLEYS